MLKSINRIANKSVNNPIVKSSIIREATNNSVHVIVQTFKQAVKYAIMCAKSSQCALNLTSVSLPLCTIFIQVESKQSVWRPPERVKVLSSPVSSDVQYHPMFTRTVMWICIADQEQGTF